MGRNLRCELAACLSGPRSWPLSSPRSRSSPAPPPCPRTPRDARGHGRRRDAAAAAARGGRLRLPARRRPRRCPKRVGIVVRDRPASPAAGRYNVCYVNGFQTQADETRFWRRHSSLVLKHDGQPVVDCAWGEWLLDIRTDAQAQGSRGSWRAGSRGCADDGFDAVEFDNLDSFTRSNG